MEDSNQKLSDTNQLPPYAPTTDKKNDEVQFLRLTIDRLLRQRTKTLSQNLGRGSLWLFKQIAGHVLMLVLGISLAAWWMLKDDSWKSYVNTGCNPSPLLYSQRFIPDHPEIKDGATWGDLVEYQQTRITQLLVVNSQLNLDRDSIRAACSSEENK